MSWGDCRGRAIWSRFCQSSSAGGCCWCWGLRKESLSRCSGCGVATAHTQTAAAMTAHIPHATSIKLSSRRTIGLLPPPLRPRLETRTPVARALLRLLLLHLLPHRPLCNIYFDAPLSLAAAKTLPARDGSGGELRSCLRFSASSGCDPVARALLGQVFGKMLVNCGHGRPFVAVLGWMDGGMRRPGSPSCAQHRRRLGTAAVDARRRLSRSAYARAPTPAAPRLIPAIIREITSFSCVSDAGLSERHSVVTRPVPGLIRTPDMLNHSGKARFNGITGTKLPAF